jgi:hypothetical protein
MKKVSQQQNFNIFGKRLGKTTPPNLPENGGMYEGLFCLYSSCATFYGDRATLTSNY